MKPLRIGLIGASGRAIIAKEWHRPETGESLVIGACDVSQKSLDDFRAWAGHDAFCTDHVQELLAQEVDAIGVFSPDRFHEEHALAAFSAGKHVFLEKPMALSTESCDRILAAWRTSGTHFMVGFNMRYMPVFAKAHELIRAGTLGNIHAIWVRHFVGAGGDFYYHDWHGTREGVTSLLLQKGSHDIDMIHWLAGAYSTRVAAFGNRAYFGGNRADDLTCPVCPDAATCPEAQKPENPRQKCAFRREIDVEDNQVVILDLENGIKASYLQCHFSPEYLRNYTVIGEKGRLEIALERNRIVLIPRTSGRTWENDPPSEVSFDIATSGTHGGADPLIAQAFLDLILRQVEPLSHPLAGRMSVAAGMTAVASLRSGHIESVPPLPDVVDETSFRPSPFESEHAVNT